jgi:hypothetical protein
VGSHGRTESGRAGPDDHHVEEFRIGFRGWAELGAEPIRQIDAFVESQLDERRTPDVSGEVETRDRALQVLADFR